MSRYIFRPRRTSWHEVDVDAIARRQSLFTQLRPSPMDPPREADRDGHSRLNLTAETSCPGCGAGEHASCECWKRGTAA